MPYIKNVWVDKEDIAFDPITDPRIEADNLNKMEDGIESSVQHTANVANPHNVTKTQIGLGNVDNTSDINKPISIPTQIALDGKENSLGNPFDDGYFLASSAAGVRQWVDVATHFEGVLYSSGVVPMNVDYTPTVDQGISTKGYVDEELVTNITIGTYGRRNI